MKRKKRTPEEWRAWRAAHEARLRELRRCLARIDAELAAREVAAALDVPRQEKDAPMKQKGKRGSRAPFWTHLPARR